MKSIKISLPSDLSEAEIHTFSDLHIGDAFCDKALIKRRIDYVRDTPNAYAILNGDIMNNATKTAISDCYAEDMTPMQELECFIDLFASIKDKILAILPGNHEARTYVREGIELTGVAARELGLTDRYAKTGAVIFVLIGDQGAHHHHHPYTYSIYALHGSGGGRKEGAKAIRLADMASVIDADIYIHSHTHLPMIMKNGFFRTDHDHRTVCKVDKLFVNTSAMLEYGGYGQEKEFKPSSKDCPVIYISGTSKNFYARL